MKTLIVPITAIVVLTLCLPQLVFGNETDAKKAFRDETHFFHKGEYIRSADAFRNACDCRPKWKHFFNIAQSEAAAKRYGLALESFETYLAQGGDDVSQQRSDDVMTEIARLRMLVGILEKETLIAVMPSAGNLSLTF